jgi:hypothetical protein
VTRLMVSSPPAPFLRVTRYSQPSGVLLTRKALACVVYPPNSGYRTTYPNYLPSPSLIIRLNSQKLATNYTLE